MSNIKLPPRALKLLVAAIALVALVFASWVYLDARGTWPRGQGLTAALGSWSERADSEKAFVARIIVTNYEETRANAARWSGVFWGFTFAAATLSALAGLILKFESIVRNERIKKDVAAVLSVTAALLITIASSGDFQRKWQANRMAAAELERIGYEFLEKNGTDPRSYLAPVGETLLRRNFAIVGAGEQPLENTTPVSLQK